MKLGLDITNLPGGNLTYRGKKRNRKGVLLHSTIQYVSTVECAQNVTNVRATTRDSTLHRHVVFMDLPYIEPLH